MTNTENTTSVIDAPDATQQGTDLQTAATATAVLDEQLPTAAAGPAGPATAAAPQSQPGAYPGAYPGAQLPTGAQPQFGAQSQFGAQPGQPGYPVQPGQYPGAAAAPAGGLRSDGAFAITSFVLGIASIVSSWTFIAPIIGLVFGILALRRGTKERTLALWGVWLNGVMLAVTALIVLGMIAVMGVGFIASIPTWGH